MTNQEIYRICAAIRTDMQATIKTAGLLRQLLDLLSKNPAILKANSSIKGADHDQD
jgi:hypothetical protein